MGTQPHVGWSLGEKRRSQRGAWLESSETVTREARPPGRGGPRCKGRLQGFRLARGFLKGFGAVHASHSLVCADLTLRPAPQCERVWFPPRDVQGARGVQTHKGGLVAPTPGAAAAGPRRRAHRPFSSFSSTPVRARPRSASLQTVPWPLPVQGQPANGAGAGDRPAHGVRSAGSSAGDRAVGPRRPPAPAGRREERVTKHAAPVRAPLASAAGTARGKSARCAPHRTRSILRPEPTTKTRPRPLLPVKPAGTSPETPPNPSAAPSCARVRGTVLRESTRSEEHNV